MKRLVLTVWIALIGCLIVAAQHTEMLAFTGEMTVTKLEKAEVYKRLSAWQHENLAKDALRECNKETGELKGTSVLVYDSNVHAAQEMTKGYIVFDFKIVATENGFRYIMTNFRHDAKIRFHTLTMATGFPYKIDTVEKPWYDLVWKDMKVQVNLHIPKMIASMQQTVENAAADAEQQEKAKDALLSQIGNE